MVKLKGGLVLLQEILNDLPFSERKAASYILEHPQKVIELNILELARASGANAAGIVRLCKRMGMKGFRELKLRATWEISQGGKTKGFLRIKPGLSIEEISRSVINNIEKTLSDLQKIIDEEAVEIAARRLMEAKRIDIYGVGASGIVAQDLYQKLLRIGLICSYNPDSHLQLTSSCGLQEGDTVVAVSYSGATRATIMAVQEAKRSGAFAVSITRLGKNKLAELCDLNLYVPSTEPLIREGAMASRIAQLAVVDILFSVIAAKSSKNVLGQLSRTMEALKRTKN